MAQPARGDDQRRPRAVDGVGEPRAVGGRQNRISWSARWSGGTERAADTISARWYAGSASPPRRPPPAAAAGDLGHASGPKRTRCGHAERSFRQVVQHQPGVVLPAGNVGSAWSKSVGIGRATRPVGKRPLRGTISAIAFGARRQRGHPVDARQQPDFGACQPRDDPALASEFKGCMRRTDRPAPMDGPPRGPASASRRSCRRRRVATSPVAWRATDGRRRPDRQDGDDVASRRVREEREPIAVAPWHPRRMAERPQPALTGQCGLRGDAACAAMPLRRSRDPGQLDRQDRVEQQAEDQQAAGPPRVDEGRADEPQRPADVAVRRDSGRGLRNSSTATSRGMPSSESSSHGPIQPTSAAPTMIG